MLNAVPEIVHALPAENLTRSQRDGEIVIANQNFRRGHDSAAGTVFQI